MEALRWTYPRATGRAVLHQVADWQWSHVREDTTAVVSVCGKLVRPFVEEAARELPLCRLCFPLSWHVEALAAFAEFTLKRAEDAGDLAGWEPVGPIVEALRWWRS